MLDTLFERKSVEDILCSDNRLQVISKIFCQKITMRLQLWSHTHLKINGVVSFVLHSSSQKIYVYS